MKHNFNTKSLAFAFLFGMLFLSSFQSIASSDSDGHAKDEKAFDVTGLITHHILDSYGWHILDYKDDAGVEHPVSIPLPIILYTDNGLVVFMSSAFHHGEASVAANGLSFSLHHADGKAHLKEYITEASGASFQDFSVTKNVASMMLSAVILIIIFSIVAAGYKKRQGQSPKGLQSLIEPLIVYIRDDVVIPNIGKKHHAKYLPYILTLFFFIWINNLLGLMPTGANLSGNIAFTMTLSVLTLVITNVSGNKNYWTHIFWTPGVPLPLRVIMLPVELISIITKPFALMIRLFANITAGHIIILSLVSFIFMFKSIVLGVFIGPVIIAMTFLELFVAILQAYVFSLLTALFIGLAIEEAH